MSFWNWKDRLYLRIFTSDKHQNCYVGCKDYLCCWWVITQVIQINWFSQQLTGQMPVQWKVTWMLVASLRGKKGWFWSHLGNLGQRGKYFLPAKKFQQKGKCRHKGGVRAWSLFQGSKTWATPILISFGAIIFRQTSPVSVPLTF